MTDFGKLSGIIEIDETLIGGKESNKHTDKKTKGTQGYGSWKTKSIVFGMIERGGDFRAFKVPDLKPDTVKEIIDKYVEAKSRIISDEYRGYKDISDDVIKHAAGEYGRGDVYTNTIEKRMVASQAHDYWHISQSQRQTFAVLPRRIHKQVQYSRSQRKRAVR